MRKLLLILAALAAALMSGCEASRVQRRLIVHAIGIDRSEKGYEVSYQVFSGSSEGEGPVDASETNVVTLLAQGRTLYETEESLRLQTGKDVFLGDVELIVISEDIKDSGLREFLQYFRRADVYLGVNVVYCRGRASETIGRKLDQGSAPAILLREAVEKAIENGRACSSRIIEISNALFEQGEAIAIPILTLEKDSDTGDEMSISDLTVGVFGSLPVWEDGFGEELSENAAMGLRLLRGDAEEMAVSVSVGGKIASVHIRDLKIRRKVEISGGAPLMNIEIAGSYEIMSAPPELKSAEISDAAEKQLLALCADAYRETAATGRDFVMLGRMLYRSEPEYIQKAGIFGAIRGAGYSVFARLQKY